MAKPHDVSARAARTWQRLTEWYGARMADAYGPTIPKDWAEVIDRTDNDTVKHGLGVIRMRYLQHPPTLPQFEQAMVPPPPPVSGPTPAVQLCAHVMRTMGNRLSARQVREPWTYVGGTTYIGSTSEYGPITGVVIPADGEHAGYRVTLEDMAAAETAPMQARA